MLALSAIVQSAPPATAPATAPTSQASDIEVREWVIFIADAGQNLASNRAMFNATLPPFMTSRRENASADSDNRPTPLGVIRFVGEVERDAPVDVLLTLPNNSDVQATWPKAQVRPSRILWNNVYTDENAKTADLDAKHWMAALRKGESSLIRSGGQAERFLLYDVALPYKTPLQLKADANGTLRATNTGGTPLLDLTFYKKKDNAWTRATIASLAGRPDATPAADKKAGPATKPDPSAAFDASPASRPAAAPATQIGTITSTVTINTPSGPMTAAVKNDTFAMADGSAIVTENGLGKIVPAPGNGPATAPAPQPEAGRKRVVLPTTQRALPTTGPTFLGAVATVDTPAGPVSMPATVAIPMSNGDTVVINGGQVETIPGKTPTSGPASRVAAVTRPTSGPTTASSTNTGAIVAFTPVAGEDAAVLSPWKDALTTAGVLPGDVDTVVSILKAHGLSERWMTAIYRLDPAEMDRLLPIEIVPTPRKITRVGLVIARGLDPSINEEIDRLIKQCGDPDYAKRKAATNELISLGQPAKAKVEKAVNDKDPEISQRAELILAAIEKKKG